MFVKRVIKSNFCFVYILIRSLAIIKCNFMMVVKEAATDWVWNVRRGLGCRRLWT